MSERGRCATCGMYPEFQGHRDNCDPTATPPHVHEWRIGYVQTEAGGYALTGAWVQVAYLLCQCGAVKRTVCE